MVLNWTRQVNQCTTTFLFAVQVDGVVSLFSILTLI